MKVYQLVVSGPSAVFNTSLMLYSKFLYTSREEAFKHKIEFIKKCSQSDGEHINYIDPECEDLIKFTILELEVV